MASISAPAHVRTAPGAPFATRSNYLKTGGKALSAVINRTGGIPMESGWHRNRGFEIVSKPFEHHPLHMARLSRIGAVVGGALLGGEGYQTPW